LAEPIGRTSSISRLYAILDLESIRALDLDPLALASAYVESGIRLLQVRAKAAGARDVLEVSRAIVDRGRSHDASVIVNDRPDIAVMAGAAGVHVGQADLPPDAVRRVMPEGEIGLSTHTLAQLEAALATPATYIAVGPVFGTSTKQTGYAAVGLDLVREAAARADRPIVAIGGITVENAASVLEAGAASVAVISDLLRGDPRERARAFVEQLG
jgi:thiamine-phosphate pyrophosphorylase